MQNGVLKALSFLFEYIGEMGKDYIYAVAPLLEDALIDRDLVHRQTAASVLQHMSLGVVGLGCEDGLTHLLNLVWPNIFETSPHLINAVMGAIDGCRLALGPPIILNYVLQARATPFLPVFIVVLPGTEGCFTSIRAGQWFGDRCMCLHVVCLHVVYRCDAYLQYHLCSRGVQFKRQTGCMWGRMHAHAGMSCIPGVGVS